MRKKKKTEPKGKKWETRPTQGWARILSLAVLAGSFMNSAAVCPALGSPHYFMRKNTPALPSSPPQNFALIPPEESLERIVHQAALIVPAPRQIAWQEIEFSAFVHFGMNTFTDREWGDGKENPSLFNPTDFDARQWVKVIKEAGMKMLILTAKHHDGFCLWPTKTTTHSVKHSPWRKGNGDVVREVATACREAGIKFGIYLSPWDRHEPTYGDSPAYNDFFRCQLRELLTGYGEIAEVWFDGACGEGPSGKRQVYDWPSYYKLVRELQPEAVIFGMGPDVRWVGTESGYGRETEWSVVPVKIKEPPTPTHETTDFPSLDDLFIPEDRTDEDLGIFKTDFAASATIAASSEAPEHPAHLILDGDPKTYWTPDKDILPVFIELKLSKRQTFNIAALREEIRLGQRVESFQLEAWDGEGWRFFARGTTVGYKRLLRFPDVTTHRIRLTITQSRLAPCLSSLALFWGRVMSSH